MTRRKWAWLLPMLLLALLCSGCSREMYIHQRPNPDYQFMYSDYDAVRSMEKMWETSDLIVVGRYENVAPRSYNIARDPDDVTKPDPGHYYDNLVNQFDVVAVLKGDCEEGVIEVGQFHGVLYPAGVYVSDTYIEPDLDSYKVLFLQSHISLDHYSFRYMGQWLTTQPVEHWWSSWEDMTFSLEGEQFDTTSETWLEDAGQAMDWDLTPPGQPEQLDRGYYTGAELLALAEP